LNLHERKRSETTVGKNTKFQNERQQFEDDNNNTRERESWAWRAEEDDDGELWFVVGGVISYCPEGGEEEDSF